LGVRSFSLAGRVASDVHVDPVLTFLLVELGREDVAVLRSDDIGDTVREGV
jgi:hypothetical protein